MLRPERSVDIIIIFDASSDLNGTELRKAEKLAQKYGYPFPTIDYARVNDVYSVYKHPTDTHAPIIIYMPLVKNPGYMNGWDPHASDFTSTFNFSYTTEQVQQLSGLSGYSFLTSKKMILETIRDWVKKKRNFNISK